MVARPTTSGITIFYKYFIKTTYIICFCCFTYVAVGQANILGDTITCKDIRYVYKITPIDSQTYSIEIMRINISSHRLLVQMNYENSHIGSDTYEYNTNDTLFDNYSQKKRMENQGITVNCDGKCSYLAIINQKSHNKLKFTIRTKIGNNGFYFYEIYWYPSPKEINENKFNHTKMPYTLACFYVRLKQ